MDGAYEYSSYLLVLVYREIANPLNPIADRGSMGHLAYSGLVALVGVFVWWILLYQ